MAKAKEMKVAVAVAVEGEGLGNFTLSHRAESMLVRKVLEEWESRTRRPKQPLRQVQDIEYRQATGDLYSPLETLARDAVRVVVDEMRLRVERGF